MSKSELEENLLANTINVLRRINANAWNSHKYQLHHYGDTDEKSWVLKDFRTVRVGTARQTGITTAMVSIFDSHSTFIVTRDQANREVVLQKLRNFNKKVEDRQVAVLEPYPLINEDFLFQEDVVDYLRESAERINLIIVDSSAYVFKSYAELCVFYRFLANIFDTDIEIILLD